MDMSRSIQDEEVTGGGEIMRGVLCCFQDQRVTGMPIN